MVDTLPISPILPPPVHEIYNSNYCIEWYHQKIVRVRVITDQWGADQLGAVITPSGIQFLKLNSQI